VSSAIEDADDDALSWAGDERDAAAIAPPKEREPRSPDTLPAPLLITYGIIAGLYLIYTLGWIITITRSSTTLPNLLGEIMFQLGEFLAIASPALWFVAVLTLTRGRKPVVRLVWLLLGLLVVVPWPFLLGV
jgi:hypothetical protein